MGARSATGPALISLDRPNTLLLHVPTGEAGLPSTARVGRAQSHRARSASNEGTQPHPNLFFSNSFTFPGFALPPLAFITWPTKYPSTCRFPSLNCAT